MKGYKRKVRFLENQKERNSTFMKRKKGLINKAHQLSVLCGSDSCVIIKINDNNLDTVDLVWTSDDTVVIEDLMNKYKQQSGPQIAYNVSSYYESMLASAKKRNREGVELPTWNSEFDSSSEYELRNLATDLEIKLDDLKNRREFLMINKRRKTVINDTHSGSFQAAQKLRNNHDLFRNYSTTADQLVSQVNPIVAMNLMNQDQIMAGMNSIEDNDCCNIKPVGMIEPDEMTPPIFDDNTLTDLERQFLYDPSNKFVNNISGGLCLWKF